MAAPAAARRLAQLTGTRLAEVGYAVRVINRFEGYGGGVCDHRCVVASTIRDRSIRDCRHRVDEVQNAI